MRACNKALALLISEIAGRAEPPFKEVAFAALEVENDHRVSLIGDFAAIGKAGELAAHLLDTAKIDIAKA